MLTARDDGLGCEALTAMDAAGLKDRYAAITPVPQLAGGRPSDLPNSALATRTSIAQLLLN